MDDWFTKSCRGLEGSNVRIRSRETIRPPSKKLNLGQLIRLVALALLWSGQPLSTLASCGRDKTPTYSDISAIRILRTECIAQCPSYEAVFSQLGLYYVGRVNMLRIGTYNAEIPSVYRPGTKPKSLEAAISILRAARFFELSLVPSLATDVPHVIIAAQRCDVTTRIDYADYGQRPDVDSLANRLDKLVTQITWKRESKSLDSPLAGFASIP
jgi:hypothetical protein